MDLDLAPKAHTYKNLLLTNTFTTVLENYESTNWNVASLFNKPLVYDSGVILRSLCHFIIPVIYKNYKLCNEKIDEMV